MVKIYDSVLKKYLLVIDDIVIFMSSYEEEINKKLESISFLEKQDKSC